MPKHRHLDGRDILTQGDGCALACMVTNLPEMALLLVAMHLAAATERKKVMCVGLLVLGIVTILLVMGLWTVIYLLVLGRNVNKLARKVTHLEQQSIGFLPASHHYLSDVNDWIMKKG